MKNGRRTVDICFFEVLRFWHLATILYSSWKGKDETYEINEEISFRETEF